MGDPLLRICSVMFAMFTKLGPHPAADALDPTRNQMVDVVYNINAWWDFKKEPTFEKLILELNHAARQQIRLLSDDELAELKADNIRLTQVYSRNRETTSGAVLVNVDIKNEAGDTMPELNVAFNDQKDVENLLANFIGRLIASSPEKTTQDLDRILAFSEAEYEKKTNAPRKNGLSHVYCESGHSTQNRDKERRTRSPSKYMYTLAFRHGRTVHVWFNESTTVETLLDR